MSQASARGLTLPVRLALAALILLAAGVGRLWSGGYLDRDAIHLFRPQGHAAPVEALVFSGDSGMRFGMAPFASAALARHGIRTVAISSSTLFSERRSRAELDAIVAAAVARAVAAAGPRRLIAIGQSYGADVLETGLADLPAALRRRIAAVVLIVPGTDVFFRADPSGLLYYLAPDSDGAATVPAIDWAPLTCIYGARETDSVCPGLRMRNATVVALPGNHYLDHDKPALAAALLRAIARTVPGVLA